VFGVAVFYTHRMAHGTTRGRTGTYESGENPGKNAVQRYAPTEAELNVMAQSISSQQGPLNSSKILREQPTFSFVPAFSKRVQTPQGSRSVRIHRSEPLHTSSCL